MPARPAPQRVARLLESCRCWRSFYRRFLQIVKFVFLIPLDFAGQFVDYVGFDGSDGTGSGAERADSGEPGAA